MSNNEIPEEKLNWLKEVGVKEFERPMKYCIHNWVLSEEYLKNTPLAELQKRHKDINSDRPGYKVE